MQFNYRSTDKLSVGDHIYTPDFMIPGFEHWRLGIHIALRRLEGEPRDPKKG